MKKYVLSLNDDLHKQVKGYCDKEGVNMNDGITNLLENSLKSPFSPKPKKNRSSGTPEQMIGNHKTFFKE